MSSLLSNPVDNLSDGFHCNKYIDCESSLDYTTTRNNQLIFRCFECKKNYQKDFNRDLINRFSKIYELCNKDINGFILLFKKGISPYGYIDSWQRYDKTSLLDKEAFYGSLNMEGIRSIGYRHAKRVYKQFKSKNLVTRMFKVLRSCLQMYLKTLETSTWKYINLIRLSFCLHQD